MRRGLAALVLVLALGGCTVRSTAPENRRSAPPQDQVAAPEPVSLTSRDGAKLDAGWRPASTRARMALVLVPMLGRGQEDYARFSQALAGYNVASLAVSLRGQGQSTAPAGKSADTFTPADWDAARADIAAAMLELERRAGDAPLGVVGASIGANLAARYTANNLDRVHGLVLLSPGLDYHGVTFLDALGKLKGRPVLVVVAAEDRQAVPLAKLQALAKAKTITLEVVDGDAHGTDLLAQNTRVTGLVLDWLGRLK